MNIDPTTLLIVCFGAVTGVCAVGYTRAVLRERREEMLRRINEVEDTLWKENEKIWERCGRIESCCRNKNSQQQNCHQNQY